jgi:hypothetical protein
MTLKAFKAAIREGMEIVVADHWIERHRNTVRTVTKVQGNGYFFTQPGEPKRFWGEYPKASELEFDGRTAIVTIGEKHWTLSLAPDGRVDHLRWEKARRNENECDAEKRMAEEAQSRGADMKAWWSEWFERSDDWRDEIGHDCDVQSELTEEVPTT